MTTNYDPQELAKFGALSSHWWDETGELKTLHQINPVRLSYIASKIDLAGKKIIDVGCGGGILSEGLAKLGANVTGIDLNASGIEVAKLHQYESGTKVEYLCIAAETIAAERAGQYDVVTCLEMLEHVPDPAAIIKAAASLVKPGGHLFFSTLNRTAKAYLFAIVGAEHVLKLLPRNTHDYAKFIKPAELNNWVLSAHLKPQEMKGLAYNPLTQTAKITNDISVNYLFYATKPL